MEYRCFTWLDQWVFSSSTSKLENSFWYEVANQSFKSVSPNVIGLNEWIHLVESVKVPMKLFMNGSLVSKCWFKRYK